MVCPSKRKNAVRAYNRKYRAEHTTDKAAVGMYNREYRRTHKKEISEYQETNRKYMTYLKRKRNREYRAAVMIITKRQHCRKKGVLFNLREEDISPLPTHCPVLGIKLCYTNKVIQENSPSLDRLDPKLGYTSGNVKVISVSQLTKVLTYMRRHLKGRN